MGIIEKGVFADCWHIQLPVVDSKERWLIINWCLSNLELNNGECPCYGKFAWSVEFLGNRGTNFTFGRERDAVWFATRWV